MPSPLYQHVINLVVSLPITRCPGVLMNIAVQDLVLLTTRFFDVAKFTILTPYHYHPDVDSHSQLSV